MRNGAYRQQGLSSHSFSDFDVLFPVPRPNHRPTSRPSTSPNFMPTTNSFDSNLTPSNEDGNHEFFHSSASPAISRYSPQAHFANEGENHEFNSTICPAFSATNSTFDATNCVWEDDFFNITAPSIGAGPPSVSLATTNDVTNLPASQAVPDHQSNSTFSNPPPQATAQSFQPPSIKNTTVQPQRHTCGIENCPKSYKRRSDLQRHQLYHSPSRDYACRFGMCKRAGANGFKRRDHLKQHLRQVHGVSQ